MKISVIIPSKNGMPELLNQLSALKAQQTSYDWEVIVSDNGSTDNTREAVEKLAPEFSVPLRIVDSSSYPGVAGARNKGVLAAEGEIVAFCDADDRVAPTWVEAMGDSLQNHDIAGGPLYSLGDGSSSEYLGRDSVFKGLSVKYSFIGCNVAISKKLFLQLDGFNWGLPQYGGEDTEFSMRANDVGASFTIHNDMKVFFKETEGLVSKLKKIWSSNIAEIHIWKLHPNKFPQQNKRFWYLYASAQSLASFWELARKKNFSLAIRYLMKPFSIFYFVVKKVEKSNPSQFLSDMNE